MKDKNKNTKLIVILLFLLFIAVSIVIGLFALARYTKNTEYLVNIKFKNAMIQPPEIHLSTEDWTSDSITAEIITDKKAKILYKIVEKDEDEESKEWIEYAEEFPIDKNCKILTKLVYKDGEGPIATKDITNIVVATTTIGEEVTGYDTLQKAVDAAGTDEAIVTLIKSVIEEGITVKENQNIELNLNGKTIKQEGVTLTNKGTLKIRGNSGTITCSGGVDAVKNEGTLIKDTETKIENISTDGDDISADICVINNTGKVTISAGTIESSYKGILNYDEGTIEVSGGTINASSTTIRNFGNKNSESSVKITGNPTLISRNGNVINNTENAVGLIYINGGTMDMRSTTRGTPTIINSGNGKIIIEKGEIITSGTNSAVFNGNSNGKTRYGTIEIRGGTITTSTMTNYNGAVYNSGEMIISGGKITSNWVGICNDGYSCKLTVSGITLTTGKHGVVNKYGITTISGGNITSNNAEAIKNDYGGTTNILGGNITAGSVSTIYNANGTVNISGGTISTAKNSSINAILNLTGTINISEGTITSNRDGIYNNDTGTIVIKGGTIISNSEGYSGILNRVSGKINMSGGVIRAIGFGIADSGNNTSTESEIIVTGGVIEAGECGIRGMNGTVIIGTHEDTPNVSITNPSIRGATGISTTATGKVYFYDGIIKSKNENSITEIETGTTIINGTEIINGESYTTSVLGPSAPVLTAKLNNAAGATYIGGTWTNNNVYISLASNKVGAGIKEYQWKEGSSGEWKVGNYMSNVNIGTITCMVERNATMYFRAIDKNGVISAESNINIKIDKTAPTVTITRTDYNTFKWTATDNIGITGYQINTSSSTPTSGWTTTGTLTSGSKDISAVGTYYVWVKDAAGNIGKATITAYTMTRNQGTGTTLTTRVDGTSSTTGTAVTANTVVLSGTPVYAIATANIGYNTVVLKNGATAINASGTNVTITANTTIVSTATISTYNISYNLQGGSVVTTNPTTYNVTTNTITLNNPTKTGYTFLGWEGSNDLSSKQFTESAPYNVAERDHIFGGTNFTVTPGKTYRIFVTAKRTKRKLSYVWRIMVHISNKWSSLR